MDADKACRIKTRWELQKSATSYIKQILEAISNKTAGVRPAITHL